jgi:hypothetical protein
VFVVFCAMYIITAPPAPRSSGSRTDAARDCASVVALECRSSQSDMLKLSKFEPFVPPVPYRRGVIQNSFSSSKGISILVSDSGIVVRKPQTVRARGIFPPLKVTSYPAKSRRLLFLFFSFM